MNKRQLLERAGLSLLMLTIAIGPLFQGYFFPTPTLFATAATSVGFVVWLLGHRDSGIRINWTDDRVSFLLLALITWSLLASLWAVYPRGQVDLILQAVAALLAFTLSRYCSSQTARYGIVWLLTTSAFLVAILGLLEYGGFFMEYPTLGEWLRVEPQRDRMFTLLQYPNTAAVFFFIVLLLDNAALVESNSGLSRILLGASSGVVATSLVLTFSRGGLLIAPLGVGLLWIGLSRRQLSASLLHFVTASILPLITVWPISQTAVSDNWQAVLLYTLAAAVVGGLASWSLGFLSLLPSRVQEWTGLALVLLLVVGSATAVIAYSDSLPGVIRRVSNIGLSDLARDGRVDFLRDAVALTARRPWGHGGGGWLRSYQQVQQVNYVARDPHSFFALTLVDAGVPGFLLQTTAIGCAAWTALWRGRGDPLRWVMAAAAVTLVAHASIDIDLSYFMMWLLLWVLLGAAQPDPNTVRLRRERTWAVPVTLTLALIAICCSLALAWAAVSYSRAEVAVMRGDMITAMKAGTRAISLDPLNSQYRTMIPSPENIQAALRLDPNNEELWRFVSHLTEEQGDHDTALVAAEQALHLRPMSVDRYEHVGRLLTAQMTSELEGGKTDQAVLSARRLIQLGTALEERGRPSLERQKEAFYTYPALTWTNPLRLAVGKAYLVVGELDAAEEKLREAHLDPSLADEATLWLHALYARMGNAEALNALEPRPSKRQLNSALYQALLALP